MSSREKKPSVVVIGAGIAGLATAYLIRRQALEQGREIDLTVLESAPQAGGATRTVIQDGYLYEAGPNGFLDNEPATLELIRLLKLEEQLQQADQNAARRYIYHGGAMRNVPLTPSAFLKSDLLPLTAKLRMALELFIPARKFNGQEETVYDFGKRRLGKSFANYLLDPMVSGIFAGDVRELSLAATFPKMVAMEAEHGGLFKAMLAKKRGSGRDGSSAGGPGGPQGSLWTFRQGMGALTGKLISELQDAVINSAAVLAVTREGEGFRIQTDQRSWPAQAVVVAAPSWAAARIIHDLSTTVSRALAEIPYAPVDVVCQGFREKHVHRDHRGFGVLIPRSEKIRSLGTLWSDSIFPGQAPQGFRLMRSIIGGACDSGIVKLTDDELKATVQRDLVRVMGISHPPVVEHLFRHPRGIAQYNLGHLERVARSEELERQLPGLFFCGASYRGVSVNGSIKDAFRVAAAFSQQRGSLS
ncbi:MAG: protoporphyrinogen oxidase [Candidatus Delongbacteria bacterium]|nr:protoporphyrinogen oxidase [Candidatus Delongbacteria bacterium]